MKKLMMTLGVLFMSAQFSFAGVSKPKPENLSCKANGKVDFIVELEFQSTDLEGQVCGYFSIDYHLPLVGEATHSDRSIYTCFNGSIFNSESELISYPFDGGINKILINYDETTGFRLTKVHGCDPLTSGCDPKKVEVKTEEKLNCTATAAE